MATFEGGRELSMTAFEYVKNLGAGWNLGNTFDSIMRRKNDKRPHETAWGNPLTTKMMIKAVRDAGFELLRLPVTWYQEMTDAPEYTIDAKFLARVKEVLDYGIELGMTVILNLHHENWLFPSDENFPDAKARMEKVWTQLANYFGDYSEKLIFEAMNEPRKIKTDVEWNGGDEEGRRVVMQLNQVFVDTVRKTGGKNISRMLLVPNYAASSTENALQDFVLPVGENIIVSIHAYIPYEFALSDDHEKNSWNEQDKADIDNLFARIDKYFISKGIPVILGETGARKKRDNACDRAEWAAYYTSKARELGIPCCWWDTGHPENEAEGSEVFGLLDRETLKWAYPDIVKAFVGRYSHSS